MLIHYIDHYIDSEPCPCLLSYANTSTAARAGFLICKGHPQFRIFQCLPMFYRTTTSMLTELAGPCISSFSPAYPVSCASATALLASLCLFSSSPGLSMSLSLLYPDRVRYSPFYISTFVVHGPTSAFIRFLFACLSLLLTLSSLKIGTLIFSSLKSQCPEHSMNAK